MIFSCSWKSFPYFLSISYEEFTGRIGLLEINFHEQTNNIFLKTSQWSLRFSGNLHYFLLHIDKDTRSFHQRILLRIEVYSSTTRISFLFLLRYGIALSRRKTQLSHIPLHPATPPFKHSLLLLKGCKLLLYK